MLKRLRYSGDRSVHKSVCVFSRKICPLTFRWQFLSSFCFCGCYLISLIVILTKLEATQEIDGCLHFATTTTSGDWVKRFIQLTRKILAPSHRPEMFDCVAVMASEWVWVVLAGHIDIIIAHINILHSSPLTPGVCLLAQQNNICLHSNLLTPSLPSRVALVK